MSCHVAGGGGGGGGGREEKRERARGRARAKPSFILGRSSGPSGMAIEPNFVNILGHSAGNEKMGLEGPGLYMGLLYFLVRLPYLDGTTSSFLTRREESPVFLRARTATAGFHGRRRPGHRGLLLLPVLLPPRRLPLPAPRPLLAAPSARSAPRLLHHRRCSPQAQPQAAQVRRPAPVLGTFCLKRVLFFLSFFVFFYLSATTLAFRGICGADC